MLVIRSAEELAHFKLELVQLEERLAHLREKYKDDAEVYNLRAAGLELLYSETAQAVADFEVNPQGAARMSDEVLEASSLVPAAPAPPSRKEAPAERNAFETSEMKVPASAPAPARRLRPRSAVQYPDPVGGNQLNLDEILADAIQCGATDIILGSGVPPCYRLGGQLTPRGEMPLEGAQVTRMFYEVLTPTQIERLEGELQVDVSLDRGNEYRFRLNLFYRAGGLAAVIRPIALELPSPEAMDISPGIIRLLERATGLIMVTGRVGTGKSTLCASFLEHLNKSRQVHIVTLEDPIEFMFKPKKAIISQREMREHAISFEAALKGVLRQSPDVIYVGELRDMETIAATLSVAETGHLVLANLHTANATQTIHRIVDVFPPSQRGLINVQLANSLTAVICQSLLPRADQPGGLVAAREILLSTPAIANLIRKNELHQIYSAMESAGTTDTKTMERSLAELYAQGIISIDTARSHAPELESLERHVDRLTEVQRKTGARRF